MQKVNKLSTNYYILVKLIPNHQYILSFHFFKVYWKIIYMGQKKYLAAFANCNQIGRNANLSTDPKGRSKT